MAEPEQEGAPVLLEGAVPTGDETPQEEAQEAQVTQSLLSTAAEEEELGDSLSQPLNQVNGSSTAAEHDGRSNDDEGSSGLDGGKKKMETFEIDQSGDDDEGQGPNIMREISEDVDDLDEEAQGLLAEGPPPKPVGKIYCFCCGPFEKLGTCTIFLPSVFEKTGWGIMGPHWFGPPCVMGVVLAASSFFIKHAFHRVGPITAGICMLWTAVILYLLINSAYRDPGIVRKDQEPPTKQHRWCELCKNYQPPKGVHCPDCNVCVKGFDQYVILANATV